MTAILPRDLAKITVLNIYCNIEVNVNNLYVIYENIFKSNIYLKTWFLNIDKDLLNKTIENQIQSCEESLLNFELKNETVRINLI